MKIICGFIALLLISACTTNDPGKLVGKWGNSSGKGAQIEIYEHQLVLKRGAEEAFVFRGKWSDDKTFALDASLSNSAFRGAQVFIANGKLDATQVGVIGALMEPRHD